MIIIIFRAVRDLREKKINKLHTPTLDRRAEGNCGSRRVRRQYRR